MYVTDAIWHSLLSIHISERCSYLTRIEFVSFRMKFNWHISYIFNTWCNSSLINIDAQRYGYEVIRTFRRSFLLGFFPDFSIIYLSRVWHRQTFTWQFRCKLSIPSSLIRRWTYTRYDYKFSIRMMCGAAGGGGWLIFCVVVVAMPFNTVRVV